jgi:hypothetical protein
MAGKRRKDGGKKATRPEPTPPGATRRAADHDLRPGEPPSPDPYDETAAGTPGGGSELGGLAGTNEGDGAPDDPRLNDVLGRGDLAPEAEGEAPPFSGPSGGAVGGTPAEGRASGGHMDHGLAPGGGHRGDSTVGSDPDRP